MHDFESARQALREPLLHQERRRAEQDDLERATGAESSSQRRFTVSTSEGSSALVQYQYGSRFASVGRR
jgi:hypothetical protein